MAHRFWIPAVAISLCAIAFAASGAEAPAVAKPWRMPRTAEGHPGLQGTWNSATLTRLERTERFAILAATHAPSTTTPQRRR
jgi:hypothetical protein